MAKQFELRKLCNFQFHSDDENITAFDGFSKEIFIGTDKGRLYSIPFISTTLNTQRPYLRVSFSAQIKKIFCASAFSTLFVFCGDELLVVCINGQNYSVEILSRNITCCSFNCHPTINDPFTLEMAVGMQSKRKLLIANFKFSNTGENESHQFETVNKINVDGGDVLAISYSQKCICYATRNAYFVYNLLTKNKIELFQFDQSLEGKLIQVTEPGEFIVTGIQGLLISVNKEGPSPKPPIIGGSTILDLQHKSHFLYVLCTDSLKIYSMLDCKLSQIVPLPSSQQESTQQNRFCRLSLLEGSIYLLTLNSLSYLHSVSPLIQVEELIEEEKPNEALSLVKTIETSPTNLDPSDLLKLQFFSQKIAFLLLEQGDFSQALELLEKKEADPRELLSLFDQLSLNDFVPSSELHRKVNGSFALPQLEMIMAYLETLSNAEWARTYSDITDEALAKIYVLLNQPKLDHIGSTNWNTSEFRLWLINQGKFNDAAKLSVDAGLTLDALNIWRKTCLGEYSIAVDSSEFPVDECLEQLKRLNREEIEMHLDWLVPLFPEKCLDLFDVLPEVYQPSPQKALELFAPYPNLSIKYLEKRIYSPNLAIFHRKLFSLYAEQILRCQDQEKYRFGFRRFILYSDHLNKQETLAELKKNEEEFAFEIILLQTDEGNVGKTLELFITEGSKYFDVSSAELLFTRFSSPSLLRVMLNFYLKQSRSNEVCAAEIPRILALFDDRASPLEVLNNTPDGIQLSDLLDNFLCRSVSGLIESEHNLKLREDVCRRVLNYYSLLLSKTTSQVYHKIDGRTRCVNCKELIEGGSFKYIQSIGISHINCPNGRFSTLNTY